MGTKEQNLLVVQPEIEPLQNMKTEKLPVKESNGNANGVAYNIPTPAPKPINVFKMYSQVRTRLLSNNKTQTNVTIRKPAIT